MISTEVNGDLVSWVHFSDLHITGENEPNYQGFLTIIEHVNANLAGQIDFAILPGDNADDGTALAALFLFSLGVPETRDTATKATPETAKPLPSTAVAGA